VASKGKAILFGLVVWFIPFVVSFLIFPLKESWRSLFESIMPVVVTLVVVVFALLYFRGVKTAFLKEGVLLGLWWFVISVLIDLPLMLSPPMNMSLVEYAADIGLTYLIMPIVTTGMGVALAGKSPLNELR